MVPPDNAGNKNNIWHEICRDLRVNESFKVFLCGRQRCLESGQPRAVPVLTTPDY